MTRPSALTIVTVVALLLAGCASLLAYNYLKKQTGTSYQGVEIVSAAVDLPIGSKLDQSMLKRVFWPKDALPPGCYHDSKPLLGRVAVRPLTAGDIITENKLMPLNVSGGIMTFMVPQGHRAVTVAVNEVAGVAGFITPSSRVDVVLTTPRPGSKDDKDHVSKIILQNVPVLATGQVTEQKEGKPTVVPTVTLDLLPDDAEKLIVGVGNKKGSLQLLLRNIIDVAAIETSGATVSRALGQTEAQPPKAVKQIKRSSAQPRKMAAPVQAAAAPPPARFSVEVFKGGAKYVRDFPQE